MGQFLKNLNKYQCIAVRIIRLTDNSNIIASFVSVSESCLGFVSINHNFKGMRRSAELELIKERQCVEITSNNGTRKIT